MDWISLLLLLFWYDVKTLINNSSIVSSIFESSWSCLYDTEEHSLVNHYLNLLNCLTLFYLKQPWTKFQLIIFRYFYRLQLEFFARKWHNPISLSFRRTIVTQLFSYRIIKIKSFYFAVVFVAPWKLKLLSRILIPLFIRYFMSTRDANYKSRYSKSFVMTFTESFRNEQGPE